jgi:hypothetical protein
MARTTHEIAIDTVHDEIVVPNPFAQALLFFRGGAEGNEKPLRIIQGPKTLLGGDMDTDNVSIDNINNEVYVTQESADTILVFNNRDSGDVAPVRILHGPKTDMRFPRRVTVDPVSNVMAVVASKGIMIYPRTANGDVSPSCVIAGPKTGLGGGEEMTLSKALLYAPAKTIIFGGAGRRSPGPKPEGEEGGGSFTAIWKYGDCGDVPPMYKMKGGSGVFDINPADKELIMNRKGRVEVYSMPEAFAADSAH